MWYRGACVLPGLENSVIIFVDYGNSENVPHANIRPMPSKFLELPCLAVHCIMSGKKYSLFDIAVQDKNNFDRIG